MKKLLLLVILIALSSSLFAQETERVEAEDKKDNVAGMDIFLPNFTGREMINESAIESEFKRVSNFVEKAKADYMFRVFYKADLILQNYTNTTYIDPDVPSLVAINRYKLVSTSLANDANIDIGIRDVEKWLLYLNDMRPSFSAIGKTNEIKQIDSDLNFCAAVLNMYKGTHVSQMKSINYLKYMISQDMITTEEMEIRVATYLACLNYVLSEKEFNDLKRIYYYNEMFDNLWTIVEKTYKDDEQKKDAMFTILIRKYYAIIDYRRERFVTTYSKYFDKLGYSYGKTEEAIMSKPVRSGYETETTTETEPTN